MRTFAAVVIALVGACGSSAPATRPPERPPEEPIDGHTGHTHEAADAGVAASHAGSAGAVDAGAADAADAPPDLLADERAAYERAAPVFQRFCASCHVREPGRSRAAALRHFDMTTYPFGGHHADEIGDAVRQALGAGEGRATMPRDEPGSVAGEDLALVLAWADAFAHAHGAGLHPPAHHAH